MPRKLPGQTSFIENQARHSPDVNPESVASAQNDSSFIPPPHKPFQIAENARKQFRQAVQLVAFETPIAGGLMWESAAKNVTTCSTGPLPELPGYDVMDLAGYGGMGVVYRARQRDLARLVAIKVIHHNLQNRADVRRKFNKEAEAIARLRHPNIVQILQVGEHESQPYMVMEYADVGTLRQLLRGKPLRPSAAAELVATLADAMQHAHRQGIVHRDLKPGNVLLMKNDCTTDERRLPPNVPPHEAELADCTPKISDFGLAKCGLPDVGSDSLTQTGAVLGTPSYMAPEQAVGNNRQVGPQADIYALGAILYELLTGRPPFLAASVVETLEQVRSREPVPPDRLQPGVPVDLRTICLKCLEKAPACRYSTAAELASDLRRFLHGEVIHARPATLIQRGWKWTLRKPGWAACVGLAVIAAIVFMGSAKFHDYQLNREVVRAGASEFEANRQKKQALETLRCGYETLDKLLQSAGQNANESTATRRQTNQLYRDALKFYDASLVSNDDQDPEVNFARAKLLAYAGSLYGLLGEREMALQKLADGRQRLESLLQSTPDDLEVIRYLALCHFHSGKSHRNLDRYKPAEDCYHEAAELLQNILSIDPEYPRAALNLAWTESSQGQLQFELHRNAEARTCWQSAAERYAEMVRRDPDDEDARLSLIGTSNYLALVHAVESRWEEADIAIDAAEAAWSTAPPEQQSDTRMQSALAEIHRYWGTLEYCRGSFDQADIHYSQAIVLVSQLVGMETTDPDFRERLYVLWRLRAWNLTRAKRWPEARTLWDRAMDYADGEIRKSCRAERAKESAIAGDYEFAVAESIDLVQSAELSNSDCRMLAQCFSCAIEAVARDQKLDEERQSERIADYALHAIRLLVRTRPSDAASEEQWRKDILADPQLAAERQTAEFKANWPMAVTTRN